METQSTLVGADGAVELYTIAQVHLYLALVVDPGNAERDDALRFNDSFYNLRFLELRMLVVDVLDRFKHFAYCLQILQFARMLALQALHNFLNFHSVVVLKRFFVSE